MEEPLGALRVVATPARRRGRPSVALCLVHLVATAVIASGPSLFATFPDGGVGRLPSAATVGGAERVLRGRRRTERGRRGLRLLLIDDHLVIVEGLTRLLERRGYSVAGSASNAFDARLLVERTPASAAIVDLELPGGGFGFVAELHERAPSLGLLVFTMHTSADHALRTYEAGALGFLSKNAAPEEIVVALDTVAAGDRYLAGSTAELLAARVLDRSSELPHERLTPREYEVFIALAQGLSSGEIAAELGVALSTVSVYRAAVLAKLGLRRNGELVRYAMARRLV